MRVIFTVEYDGTDYCGWQIQDNGITVQQTMEEAHAKIFGERTRFTASGRTDSGVHAAGQVVHFDTEINVSPEGLMRGINSALPPDIRVIAARFAPEGFHARFSTKKKTYEYRAYESDVERPLKSRYAVRINTGADIEKMRAAARVFEGEHDFAALCAAGSSVKDTVRRIYSIAVDRRGDDLIFTVTGNGFLYKMVRTIAGTLLDAGYGKISSEDIADALNRAERSRLGKTMPPEGLTLVKVEYD